MADNTSFPLCTFCDERNTKYSCVSCNKVACNICTKPAPEHTGCDEENKKVGICQNCLQNIDTMTVSDNNKNLPVSKVISSFNSQQPRKKKQKTLDNLIMKSLKTPRSPPPPPSFKKVRVESLYPPLRRKTQSNTTIFPLQ